MVVEQFVGGRYFPHAKQVMRLSTYKLKSNKKYAWWSQWSGVERCGKSNSPPWRLPLPWAIIAGQASMGQIATDLIES